MFSLELVESRKKTKTLALSNKDDFINNVKTEIKNENFKKESAWLVRGHVHACLVRKDERDIHL